MEQHVILLGVVLIFLGMLLVFAGSLLGKQGKIEWGIGGFIGPIPFGFASNKAMLYILVALLLVTGLILLAFRH